MARPPQPSSARRPSGARPGSTSARRPASRRRRFPLWRVLAGVVVLGALLLVAGLGVGYALTPVPQPSEFGQKAATVVYYADGTTEMGRFADVNRTPVASDAIAEPMKQAMVAAEDRSFYDNRGVSPTSIVRAFWSNVRGNATQGGSTITQQYVKNYYLDDPSRTLTRKAREAFISLKVDRELSKDEILTNYLNTIYFGRGAYGVQEAARAYFGVDAADLTVSQAALLAGVVPSPSTYDPAENAQDAQDRWSYVLDGLVATGAITQADRDAQTFPEVRDPSTSQTYAGPKGYVLQTVRTELEANGFSETDLDSGGLRITTTIDEDMQDAAVRTVQDPEYTEGRPDDVQTALVSIDPETGAVEAMYGGADYTERSQNAVTQDRAQAGSTFKPFTLVAALEGDETGEDGLPDGEDGISLRTVYNGNSPRSFDFYTDEGEPVEVNNFGHEDWGYQDLVGATEHSINTVYVPLNEDAGPQHTVDVAVRAGLPEDTVGLEAVPSNVLGSASPHPIDMARVFATYAAQGVRTTPHVVAAVADESGETVFTGDTSGTRVIDADVMADATYAMEQVISDDGTAPAATALDRPAAGKTGTSSNNKSAWFAGFTPQLATVVAIYRPSDEADAAPGSELALQPGWGRYSGRDSITGGSFPVYLWTEYMEDALDGQPVLDLPDRAYVGVRGGGTSDRSSSSSSSSSGTEGSGTAAREGSSSGRSTLPRASTPSTPSTGSTPSTPSETRAASPATSSPTGTAEPSDGEPAPATEGPRTSAPEPSSTPVPQEPVPQEPVPQEPSPTATAQDEPEPEPSTAGTPAPPDAGVPDSAG